MEEYHKRQSIFRQNYIKMATMLPELGHVKGPIRYSPFMDLTEEEFSNNFGFNYNKEQAEEARKSNSTPLSQKYNLYEDTPASYDWRDQGAVTEVKNQGSCGSCWAFSATGNIEGQTKLAKGVLTSISEQELVDCDKVDEGCNGGLMEQAFDELKRIGGTESEADYPYKGVDGTCQFDASRVDFQVKGYSFVDKDENVIKETLFKYGPLAVALNATPLQFYFGGIFHPWKILCNPDALNHGVLIVGYGTENGKDYWIVKNSWGKLWGEKGYFRIFRGDGTCGINTHVVGVELQ